MVNDFKFRTLTSEDWEDIEHEALIYEVGLKLRQDKLDGTYISEPLDSGKGGCRWHRIVLDADIPETSNIIVSFFTSETENPEYEWSGAIEFKDTKDALVQALPGRYMTLKIDFRRESVEDASPVLRQLKIYYPRLSYLRYLPSVYQEDSASKDFLERFLSIFESVLYDNEETISRLPRYFDPMAAPKDFVPWLANWLSLDLYELLGEKNREFILRATEFYKQKGTAFGLANLVSFLTGVKKCCVKEYVDNVFRTYGMEHRGEHEIEEDDERGCVRFYRKLSTIVDTEDGALLENIGNYHDELNYTTDTSKEGLYNRNVVGLFIFLSLGEKFVFEKDQLHKLIRSFLPVFVRVDINVVEASYDSDIYNLSSINEEYYDHIHAILKDEARGIEGKYIDNFVEGWKWFLSYDTAENNNDYGVSNDLRYGTPHNKVGVELPI